MTSAILGVACGEVSLDNLREMLDKPFSKEHEEYFTKVRIPSFALYLANVQYNKDGE